MTPTLLLMSDDKRRARPAAQYGPTAETVAQNVRRLREARGLTIYALSGALARFGRRPLGALFEAAVLGIALALPLAFLLAVENVRSLAARHPAVPEMSVFLALEASPEEVEDIAIGRADQKTAAARGEGQG